MTSVPDDSDIARRVAEHREQFCGQMVRNVESVRSQMALALKMAQMQNGDTLKAKAGALAQADAPHYETDGDDNNLWTPDELAAMQALLTKMDNKLRAAQRSATTQEMLSTFQTSLGRGGSAHTR